MTLTFNNIRLLVNDLETCTTFYRDTLGFEMTWGDQDYAEFKASGGSIALFRRQFMAAAIGTAAKPLTVEAQDRTALVFRVENVDTAYQQLKTKGVTFITEPNDRPTWGIRVAHFRDPDGNLIEINANLSA